MARDYSKNHVFDATFTAFCVAMQTAIAVEMSVVAMELKVVEKGVGMKAVNGERYVVPARVYNWEEMLPPFLKKDVVPAGPGINKSTLGKVQIPNVSHYPTMKLQLDDAQSNLLANMMGWVVFEKSNLFCRGLGVIGGCPKQ